MRQLSLEIKNGENEMKKINGKEIKVTSAGYLYINGVKVWKIKITPLHVPGPDITGDEDITAYARKWAHRNYTMVQS